MSVERDLLRKAWPQGYLLVPGLRTVGDWMCVSVHGDFGCFHLVYGPKRRVCLLGEDMSGNDIQKRLTDDELAAGDFLPAVDPTDVATWAICKDDLARAVWSKAKAVTGIVFTLLRTPDEWSISAHVGVNDHRHRIFRTTALDFATALVQARIELREDEDR